MSRFNPRLIAVVIFAVVGYAAFHFMNAKRSDWREFAASEETQITAFALLGRGDDNGKDQKWRDAQPRLHHDIVLSQTLVQDANARRQLRQSFLGLVPIESGPDCSPIYRHTLRFETKERTVEAMICFDCGIKEVFDSAGKTKFVYFSLNDAEGLDQFDAIFARLGLKQFKPTVQGKRTTKRA